MAKLEDNVKRRMNFRNAGEALNLMDMLRQHNAFSAGTVTNVGAASVDPIKR